MGEILVITSGKGGTGKTTLTAGIASCMAALGQKILAIDCDIGLNNLDISLGMSDCATITFLDIMMENQTLNEVPEHPVIPGLHLLTAPSKRRSGLIDDIIFGRMLDDAAELFDWVLLDAPAGIGFGFDLATAYANRAIVIATADPASIRDCQETASLLFERNIDSVQLVVNRVTRKLLKSLRSTIDDMMDDIGLPLLGLIPEDSAVPVAASDGQALVLQSRKGAAVACLQISRRLLGMDIPLLKVSYF